MAGDERCEIITNDQGTHTTSSWVAFTETELLIGDDTTNQVWMNPHITIFDVKRLNVHKTGDQALQSDVLHFPFKVVHKDGKPHIQSKFKDKTQTFSPRRSPP